MKMKEKERRKETEKKMRKEMKKVSDDLKGRMMKKWVDRKGWGSNGL